MIKGAKLTVLALMSIVTPIAVYTRFDSPLAASVFYWITFGDSTILAPHFTERGFRSIRVGMHEQTVFGLIGRPLSLLQCPKDRVHFVYGAATKTGYPNSGCVFDSERPCTVIITEDGVIQSITGHFLNVRTDTHWIGRLFRDFAEIYGAPHCHEYDFTSTLCYSKAGEGGSYRIRKISLDANGIVREIVSEFYVD